LIGLLHFYLFNGLLLSNCLESQKLFFGVELVVIVVVHVVVEVVFATAELTQSLAHVLVVLFAEG